MSLATRCPACRTAFRVVQDQLKVSQGWVRCGQCHEVFNASQALFDLPAPTATPTPPTPSPAPSPEPTPEPRPALEQRVERSLPVAADASDTSATPPTPPAPANISITEPSRPSPVPPWPDGLPSGFPDSQLEELPNDLVEQPLDHWDAFVATQPPRPDRPGPQRSEPAFVNSDVDAVDSAMFDAEMEALQADAAALSFAPGGERDVVVRQPRFLQEAERAARWRQPGVRVLLGAAVALLLLVQIAQIGWNQRDMLAARWPALTPLLAAACQSLHCQLQAPLMIDQVVLDSTHLAATRQPGILVLTADLHNRALLPVRMPALELTITSDAGQVLARKVLTPSGGAGGAGSPPLPLAQLDPEGSQSLTLYLAVGDLKVAGYTVELFYP